MKTEPSLDVDRLCIDTIRALSVDAVERARSGHPGAPMGAAPMAYVLWDRFLRHNPRNPAWPDRDRFVLSCGHASMLLWSVLHLTGTRAVNADYERLGQPSVTLDDIRRFRQDVGTDERGEGLDRDQLDAVAQQPLEEIGKRHEAIEALLSGGELDEEVHVAVRAGLAARHGAEKRKAPNAELADLGFGLEQASDGLIACRG